MASHRETVTTNGYNSTTATAAAPSANNEYRCSKKNHRTDADAATAATAEENNGSSTKIDKISAATMTDSVQSHPSVSIEFRNVVYKASLGIRKGTKEILHQISGTFDPGQLIAIMGPSGAGKSTLLDILSSYKIKGVEGKVFTNGTERNMKTFRLISCYITQDDRLQPLLTVEENMRIAADLKLPLSHSLKAKQQTISDILSTLGLTSCNKTISGGLSGGQKKRLSIALELINNPLVMFLDEPTTGLDSLSCTQCIRLLKMLAHQGKTIICTIHQPSATLFQLFDQVYIMAAGSCLYQGTANKLVPYLHDIGFPCPMYHNPADYIIELASGDYGYDKVDFMVKRMENGKNFDYFEKPNIAKQSSESVDNMKDICENQHFYGIPSVSQLKVLLRRGYIKAKRDQTLTYMRITVNIFTAIMLGTLYWQAGADGSKVLDNYNLLFSILMHHMMSTMMLTILTFPSEMSILIKEHFNRWYSLKMYYAAITLVDIPLSILCCFLFTIIIYCMTGQPLELSRLGMFFTISLLVVFVAQSFGLMIGAVLNVVNGTFLGPTLSVPIMMFSGFGVSLRDLPWYFYWGSYVSYLRYGLEGYLGAIYGLDRPIIDCPDDAYCHYRYPKKFLEDIAMQGDQFVVDTLALIAILLVLRILAYLLLRIKLQLLR